MQNRYNPPRYVHSDSRVLQYRNPPLFPPHYADDGNPEFPLARNPYLVHVGKQPDPAYPAIHKSTAFWFPPQHDIRS